MKVFKRKLLVATMVCLVPAGALAQANGDDKLPKEDQKVVNPKKAKLAHDKKPDEKKGGNKKGPQGSVYGSVRYEDDYSFLNNGRNRGSDPFNRLKKIPLGRNAKLTLGGSYRFRFENDDNRRFGASNPQAQSFYLNRLFLFTDLQIAGRVRLFSEFKYASITNNKLPAPPTAHDKPDIQNLFADIWLLKEQQGNLGIRVGRNEMQFGKQRLIGTSDWVNTRRTFDGARLMASASGWKFDGFFTRPVELDPDRVNRADHSQTFAGTYAQRSRSEE